MKKFISLILFSFMMISSVEANASMLNLFDYISLQDEKLDLAENNTEKDVNPKEKDASKDTNSKDSTKISQNNIEVFNQNGYQLNINQSDIDLMAKLVYCESRGEPFEGQVAVASVVLNRVMDPQFPDTISEVIFQKNAFSCVKDGKLDAKPTESCYSAVYEAIQGKDPTNDALFFYNPSIATCSWMKETSKKDSKTIGNHTFFKK